MDVVSRRACANDILSCCSALPGGTMLLVLSSGTAVFSVSCYHSLYITSHELLGVVVTVLGWGQIWESL